MVGGGVRLGGGDFGGGGDRRRAARPSSAGSVRRWANIRYQSQVSTGHAVMGV